MNPKDLFDSEHLSVLFVIQSGGGKSLGMCLFTFMLLALKKYKRILTNMPIFFSQFKGIEYIPLIETAQLDKIDKKTIIILDELQLLADSRKSNSHENAFLTDWQVSIRKVKSIVLGSCQKAANIDIRIWSYSTLRVFPEWKRIYNDSLLRFQEKDFRNTWHIQNVNTNETEKLTVNLLPFINNYNTDFTPFKPILSHEEFMVKKHPFEGKNGDKFYQMYLSKFYEYQNFFFEGFQNVKGNWEKAYKRIEPYH